MDEYEQLLEKAYQKVKVIEKGSERFEIPKVEGHIEGNNTIITNFQNIAGYLRRDSAHLAKFLQKELAVSGRVDTGRLFLKSKINSSRVNEKIAQYAKEFVICSICGKPDTEMIHEKSIKIKHCLACGARTPVKYHL